jgi:hypothetical protein
VLIIFQSTAAYRMHNLDPIAFIQPVPGVQAARHYFAIDFHSQTAALQLQQVDNILQGRALGQLAAFAVDHNIHKKKLTTEGAENTENSKN